VRSGVVSELRALASYCTKGLDNRSLLREDVDGPRALAELPDLLAEFFFESLRQFSIQPHPYRFRSISYFS
jgi:hypothetical protein